MKLNNKCIALSVFAFSSSAFADLTLPATVDVLALNGKQISESSSLNLPEGRNQLVIQYVERLRKGSDRKRYKSKPYVTYINVNNVDDNATISHRFFRDYDNAKAAFATNKVDWTFTVNHKSTSLIVDELPGAAGFLPYRDIEKLVALYNEEHDIKIDNEPASESADTDAASASDEAFVNQIKQWYNNASDSERKAVLTWMIQQQ